MYIVRPDMPFKVGDRVRIRNWEDLGKYGVPHGHNSNKASFMDGKTVYEVEKVEESFHKRWGNWKIRLKGVQGRREDDWEETQWTFSETVLIPAEKDMTRQVHDILLNNMIEVNL